MKPSFNFIFADSLDFVDPHYDFIQDRFAPDRELYWGDQYPHEILGYAPYDGILVSRAIVGGNKVQGKYSPAQAMRLRRDGARKFLRFAEEDYPKTVVFGDSGAFSYHKMEVPPYSASEMVDFYSDGQFTHGCSVDHIIFDFVEDGREEGLEISRLEENKRRFEVTLTNAEEFLEESKRMRAPFTPLGVVQGWSPSSMAESAVALTKMGYTYLAIGGMAPLRSEQIKLALGAIRDAVGFDISIHVLGFAKAEEIGQFGPFKITSFDSTSPLVRAFKDSNRNYFALNPEGGISYYSAIRVPQATENNILKSLAKQGVYNQEELQKREQEALRSLRDFDAGRASWQDALSAVMAYSAPIAIGRDEGHTENEVRKLQKLSERYARTLRDAPWQKCDCPICTKVGIEVIIFRGSNRNKRRGIHNLQAYRRHIQDIERTMIHGRVS